MASTLQETVREDGLRVITKKLPNTKRTLVSASALVGSVYDGDDKEGFFHFYEHMGFKGTKTRSMKKLKEILGPFRFSNAFTANTITTYIAEVVYTKKELLQDVIFDIYLNPAFPEEEIEKEKGVVLREAAERNDDDGSFAWQELGKVLWKSNPLRRAGVGTSEGMLAISQETLLGAHQKWYAPSNTVVLGFGHIDHDWLTEKAFTAFPVNLEKVHRGSWSDEYNDQILTGENIFERKGREKSVVLYGCKVFQCSPKEKMTIDILSRMIGGGFDSLLFHEVRDMRGWAYATYSYFDANKIGSFMGFNAEVAPDKVEDARVLVKDIVCDYPLDENHFLRVKEGVFDELAVKLESAYDWFSVLSHEVIVDGHKLSFLNNYVVKQQKLLAEVNFEDVLEMRKKLIIPERLACIITKPV